MQTEDSALPPAPLGSFTIVAIPDTQAYAQRWPERFERMTAWIVEHIEDQRIVFCSHLGDLVEHFDDRREWQAARRAMDRLHGRLPYGISFGNHDLKGGHKQLIREHFPAVRYEGMPWFGGSHDETNTFQLISAEGRDFLLVHLDCNACDATLAWANRVMTAHAARRIVVVTHHYLGRFVQQDKRFGAAGGRMSWARFPERNTPQQMWEKCFCRHRNLFLILCGDQAFMQAMRRTDVGDHGNIVHELESDYMFASRCAPAADSPQAETGFASAGHLRLLRFLPEQDRIEVRTWCALEGKMCLGTPVVPDPRQHCFDLAYPMNPPVS